eukprot:comp22630_c0_seq1/m.34799 comp22630_c0_seq1/g.34799  ORF comp22630_c0_seq1/g.34799 comp22630_c0_seq1/m.34799 type:complete len:262 (-) comp22630_c0_seq1:823-1608(-)
MLRHMLICNDGGLTLYSKEFVPLWDKERSRAMGNLMTAVNQMCRDCVGHPPSYIELATVGVSICVDGSKTKVVCALFHDKDDGEAFGRIVATELLRVFVDTYGGTLGGDRLGAVKEATFAAFHARMAEAIRNAVRPILRDVAQAHGVEWCGLTQEHSLLHATQPLDQLALVANLDAFVGYCIELQALVNDRVATAILGGSRRVLVCQVSDVVRLVVVMDLKTNYSAARDTIDQALVLISKVFALLGNLQGGTNRWQGGIPV